MKKFKVIVSVMFVLIWMFMMTACAAVMDSDDKCTMMYSMKEAIYPDEHMAVDDFCFTSIIGEDAEIVEMEDGAKKELDSIGQDLFDFIVKKYDLDWEYQNVEIVFLDFSTVAEGEYAYYGAMADVDCNIVYLNTYALHTFQDYYYRSIHELIHCMVYKNNGTMNFAIYDDNGKFIGYYVSEAITDLIAVDYLDYVGEENALDYFLNGSNYCYTVVTLQILEHSIPEMKKMYLDVDAEAFRQEVKALGEIHIEDGAEVDYGEVLFYQADMYQKYSIATMYASSIEEYAFYAQQTLKCMLGNYEIAYAVSDELEPKEEKAVLEYIKHIAELEGGSEVMSEYVKYFGKCMK